MPVSRVFLSLPESADIVVPSSTLRTLCFLTLHLVQTALMKGVLAKEMNGRQIQDSAAGSASSSLENRRFVPQVVLLFAFRFRLSAVAFDQTAILRMSVAAPHQGTAMHTLDISFFSLSTVSLRYFLTIPIVATALVLSVCMTCNGAMSPS